MSSSQKKPTKSTKTKATKRKTAPSPVVPPSAGCYVPQPPQMVDQSMQYGQYPPNWGHPQYVNTWVQQPSPPPQVSPPMMSPRQMSSSPHESQTQYVAETQFLYTPRRLEDEDFDDEEEEEQQEEEAEDLGEPEQQAGSSEKGKTTRIPWTDDEIRALGEAWVDCSQQAEVGINQTTNTFKTKVWKSWCTRMGSKYRKPSTLYSKWRSCNKAAMEFQGCHSEVERQHQSGTNGDDVMSKARALFHAQYDTQFKDEVFWRAVKDYEKWRQLESYDQFVIHLAKKHKASETTQSPSSEPSVGFNLNSFDPEKPMGRDQAKRKSRGKGQAKSTTSNTSSVHEDVVAFGGNVEAYREAQKMKESNLKIKEKMQLRKIIQEDISGKTGFEYQVALEMKKAAARELGLHFDE